MALIANTILQKSPTLLSSLNDIWGNTIALGLSSSNTSKIGITSSNFKYFIDLNIYDVDDNIRNLGRFNTVPRPIDNSGFNVGYGAISTYAQLRSFIDSFPINPTLFTTVQPVDANLSPFYSSPIVRYNFDYGFQYNPNLNGRAIIINLSGTDYLGFSFSTPHPFVNNSEIFVVSDNEKISGNFIINSSYNVTFSFATTNTWTSSMSQSTNLMNISSYTQQDGNSADFYGFDGTIDFVNYSLQDIYLFDYLIVDGIAYNAPSPYRAAFKFLSNYSNSTTEYTCDLPIDTPTSQCFRLAKRLRVDDYET
jgi:hypothetical protein